MWTRLIFFAALLAAGATAGESTANALRWNLTPAWSQDTSGAVSSEGTASKEAWLRSENELADFELKFEYRLASGANGGVSLRCPKVGDPAHDGIEIQLLDDGFSAYRNLKSEQHTGAIYMQAAPRTRSGNAAGEWNVCEISCRGSEVSVRINAIEVNRVNLNSFKKGLDGRTPLSQRLASGVLALEARNGAVAYRKIVIEKK